LRRGIPGNNGSWLLLSTRGSGPGAHKSVKDASHGAEQITVHTLNVEQSRLRITTLIPQDDRGNDHTRDTTTTGIGWLNQPGLIVVVRCHFRFLFRLIPVAPHLDTYSTQTDTRGGEVGPARRSLDSVSKRH
jgi:hypothetical protein